MVVSRHVSRPPYDTWLCFCPNGCTFGLPCLRPGFEPHGRSGEKIVVPSWKVGTARVPVVTPFQTLNTTTRNTLYIFFVLVCSKQWQEPLLGHTLVLTKVKVTWRALTISRCPFEDCKPENEWFCQIYALRVGHVESHSPLSPTIRKSVDIFGTCQTLSLQPPWDLRA